jgi:DNA helicase II / ATP-dependent DNA helicase PcrA
MVNLNRQQCDIVNQEVKPILALAGAGSGKTTVLTNRILHLIENGADPAKICSVTFTNKAAKEMKSRVHNVVGDKANKIIAGTFHSVCSRLLRKYGSQIGIDPKFTIADTDDSLKILKDIDKDYGKETLSLISNSKSLLQTPADLAQNRDRSYNQEVAKAYESYEERLNMMNMLDFDDLIVHAVRLFRNSNLARERIDHLLIDEYQDVSYAQKELCKLMSINGSIFAVGDDSQNIYSWRNADVEYILGFKNDYPNCEVMNLERNYRSSGNIVQGSNAVISNNKKQFKKKMFTEKDMGDKINIMHVYNEESEAFYVCQRVREHHADGDSYGSMAVLYRTNMQSRAFEEAFMRANVPYRIIGNVKFYERAEVKDVIAYIQLLYNHKNDIALKRIINVPKRGLGKSAITKLSEYATKNNMSLYEACKEYDKLELPKKQTEALRLFVHTIDTISEQIDTLETHNIVSNIVAMTGYLSHLDKDTERIGNINELVYTSQSFDTVQEFLENVALISDTDELDEAESITIMTVHSAKGLEFDTVFIVGAEEGLFPHINSASEQEKEEERRLFYVAMTRAAKHLYITYVKSRFIHWKTTEQKPSRFVDEIPEQYVVKKTGRLTRY